MGQAQNNNHAVEKLRFLYLDPKVLLLSLSGGQIRCHTFPRFERLDVLEVDHILDFEAYHRTERRGQNTFRAHYLAILLTTRQLKIYEFSRLKETY